MVEVHSSPRVAIRTSAKSAQSLIVVLFLVLVLYIFFFGKGNGKDKANSVQHEGTPGKQGHSRARGPVSFRDNCKF